jgi:histidinol-phosphate aminotransferase
VDIEDLVNPAIWKLKPYRPGKPIEEVERELGITDVAKLASNENPLGPSPRVLETVAEEMQRVRLYPDADSYFLKRALGGHWGVGHDMLTVGNGSDDIIHFIGLTFLCPGDEVVISERSFVRYEAAATLNESVIRWVPLKDHTYDLKAMRRQVNDKTKLVFISNPNNPTGTAVGQAGLDEFMDGLPERVIVVFDEAYCEYVTMPDFPDTLPLAREDRNVFVLRTFSKVYGLAGLRIGYGIAKPDLIKPVEIVREPFNTNRIAQAAAIAALADQEHVRRVVRNNAEGIGYIVRQCGRLGLRYIPTQANFIMIDVGRDCVPVFEALVREGLIVRTGDIFGMPTWIRVTIGTPSQNARFISTLERILS